MIFKNITKILFFLFMVLNISVSHAEQSLFEKTLEDAQQGDAMAQFFLGSMYRQGRGVAQDEKEAVQWFLKALGQGIAQDHQKVAWYRKAARQGYADAQLVLGWMYDRGEGVAQDYMRAHMWYNIAAANGHGSAHKGRDLAAKVIKGITPKQIIRAQDMARQCIAKDYKNC